MLEQYPRSLHCSQRRFQIVHDECEVLFAALLDLQRLLAGERIDCRGYCAIEDAVHDLAHLSGPIDTVLLAERLYELLDDVVLRYYFNDVEPRAEPCRAVHFRAVFKLEVHDRLRFSRNRSEERRV